MSHRDHWWIPLLVLPLVAFAGGCTPPDADGEQVAEHIRDVERQRLRALVDADMPVARRLHASDFQLINPAGVPVSFDEYMGGIESQQLDYTAWEPGDIVVKIHDDAAVIRYRDTRFDVNINGEPVHRGPMYHTNLYERRDGQWQVVWSQASGIITP